LIHERRVLRHEHERFDAGSGSVSGHRPARVAGRRDGDAIDAELAAH
jgi:hypothetical protein